MHMSVTRGAEWAVHSPGVEGIMICTLRTKLAKTWEPVYYVVRRTSSLSYHVPVRAVLSSGRYSNQDASIKYFLRLPTFALKKPRRADG